MLEFKPFLFVRLWWEQESICTSLDMELRTVQVGLVIIFEE